MGAKSFERQALAHEIDHRAVVLRGVVPAPGVRDLAPDEDFGRTQRDLRDTLAGLQDDTAILDNRERLSDAFGNTRAFDHDVSFEPDVVHRVENLTRTQLKPEIPAKASGFDPDDVSTLEGTHDDMGKPDGPEPDDDYPVTLACRRSSQSAYRNTERIAREHGRHSGIDTYRQCPEGGRSHSEVLTVPPRGDRGTATTMKLPALAAAITDIAPDYGREPDKIAGPEMRSSWFDDRTAGLMAGIPSETLPQR